MIYRTIFCVLAFIPALAMASVEDEQFDKADLNRDGKISAAEFSSFGKSNLSQADANGDGKLDSSEILRSIKDHYADIMQYAKAHAADIGPKIDHYTQRALAQLATKKDFSIPTSKITAQEGKAFSKVDRNKDGFLSKDEIAAAAREAAKTAP